MDQIYDTATCVRIGRGNGIKDETGGTVEMEVAGHVEGSPEVVRKDNSVLRHSGVKRSPSLLVS